MPVLINPENQQAQDLAPDAAQSALQQGWHVPLVDSEGNAFSAPHEEATRLVQAGTHAQPNQNQLQYLLNQTKYSAPTEQAKAFIEGAVSGLTGPLGSAAETGLGISTPEEIQNRKEFNPGTSTLGEVVGMTAGLAAPETLLPKALNLPGMISKAGRTAAEGINATGIFGKAAQIATQGAIEGALYGASHEANEALLGNPNATAENMLSHIGISAALGGGLNLALAPAFAGIGKVLDKGMGFFGRAGKVEGDGSIVSLLPHTGLDETERKSVLDGLSELKPNADEVVAAGQRLGAPVLESQLSASKTVQDWDSSMINSGNSWTAIQRQQLANQGYKAASHAVNEALGTGLDLTRADVGNQLKEGITKELEGELAPINDAYKEIQARGESVAIDEAITSKAAKNLLNSRDLVNSEGKPLSESSPNYQLVKRVAGELPNLKTVDDVLNYTKQLSIDTSGITNYNLKHTVGQIRDQLNEIYEKAIIEKANDPQLAEQIAQTKSFYAAFRDKLDQLGPVLGKKLTKGQGATAFMDWLDNTPPEQIAKRLFAKDNSEFLSFFKERFPEQADLLAQYKKSELRGAALKYSKDGEIVPKVILKQVNELEPEAQKFLFNPDDLQKIKDADTYLRAFPDNVNPSGTARTLSMFDLFNPTKLPEVAGRQIADYTKKKIIEQLVRQSPSDAPLIQALAHISDLSYKATKAVERSAGGIFGSAATSFSNKKNNTQPASEPLEIKKIGTMVQNFQQNPQSLIEHLSTATGTLSQYAPDTVNALTSSVGRGVSFLASKAPKMDQKLAPLDKAIQPSNMEIAKFNRYAAIVEDPTEVLSHVKNGTILPQDIEALSQVYPQMYGQMREAVTNKMIGFLTKNEGHEIPYKTKLGLSMFLGQNLDSTMVPQNILHNQLAMATSPQQQGMPQAQQARPSKTGMQKMHFLSQDQTAAQLAASRRGKA